MTLLALLFLLVALVYASVGFGGGSTYTALLGLWGVDFTLIPLIALLCNIIVVTGGVWRFQRSGLIDWKAVLPLLLVSAPLAFLGGLVPLKQWLFLLILGVALFASCVALLVQPEKLRHWDLPKPWLYALSSALGLLAGLSGIGGGIFMAPLLHLVRWADGRRIAAFASLYILVNSIAGLTGQITKSGVEIVPLVAANHWQAMLAVLIGGHIGSTLGIRFFSPNVLKAITAILVGYVAVRLVGQSLNF
jgi:uncharacterized protein